MKRLLAVLLAFAFVAAPAFAEVTLPVDDINAYCNVPGQTVTPLWCSITSNTANVVSTFSDTSNSMTSAQAEAGAASSDTVRDVETAIIEEDISLSKGRVSHAWGSILSLIILVVELVQIAFYMAQLFILLHLPYFYVKLLVFIKTKAFHYANAKRSRS